MYWKKIIRINPNPEHKLKRPKKDYRIVIDDMYNYNQKVPIKSIK